MTLASIGKLTVPLMLFSVLTGCATSPVEPIEQNLYDIPMEFDQMVSNASRATFEISCDGIWVGSGWAINFPDEVEGYIITAYHVVEDCLDSRELLVRNQTHSKFQVELVSFDGRYWDDLTVENDEIRDLALLKSKRPLVGLDVFTGEPKVGHWVTAAGFPALHDGTEPLFTSGQVSGFDSYRMLSIDAVVNSGASGGPVLNSEGLVVGTAFANSRQQSSGSIGFIQPIRMHCELAFECKGAKPLQPLVLTRSPLAHTDE
jgi:S1-C subfamily serine protease